MRTLIIHFILLQIVYLSFAAQKEERAFSLFSVVSFKNEPCQSTSTTGSGINRNGTCFTSTECTEKSGTAAGNCASGFGICCIFTINDATSTTISQNNTYIQNPSFPAVYTETTAITYTVNKCADNICAIRLDLETFVTLPPSDKQEASGGPCVDKFTITTTTAGNSPEICGTNTGQHMYAYLGPDSGKTADLKHEFTGSSTVRTWEIKVSQIECGATSMPPDGCLQYHVGTTGRIKTFNFDESTAASYQHLASQQYSVCIRQEQGHCCVSYVLCQDETKAWSIDLTADGTPTGKTGDDCTGDYIGISGASDVCTPQSGRTLTSRICGAAVFTADAGTKVAAATFHQVCDCTAPFIVEINTDATQELASTAGNHRGACLDYTQVAC